MGKTHVLVYQSLMIPPWVLGFLKQKPMPRLGWFLANVRAVERMDVQNFRDYALNDLVARDGEKIVVVVGAGRLVHYSSKSDTWRLSKNEPPRHDFAVIFVAEGKPHSCQRVSSKSMIRKRINRELAAHLTEL